MLHRCAALFLTIMVVISFGCATFDELETERREGANLSDLSVAEQGEFQVGDIPASTQALLKDVLGSCITYDGETISACEPASAPSLEPQGNCGIDCWVWYPTGENCYFYVGEQKKCGWVSENCCGGRVCTGFNC